MPNDRFQRTAALIGQKSLDALTGSRVAVFGIGGVGGFAAEALVRSGVGAIDIFDNDTVDITNINRQIIALDSTVGELKTTVMAKRLKDINPSVVVGEHPVFITPEVAGEIDFSKYDCIIDAVDNVTAKIAICDGAVKVGTPVISAMGAGNKLDPTKFEVAPIEKTSVCPLAKAMRLELKKRGIKGVTAVYSKEPAIKRADGEKSPASIAFVPSVMGLIMAGEAVKKITQRLVDSNDT